MVMTLGDGHRVVIRLASAYAPEHVANLKRLAKARWWDGESVYRVQENWVAQWGDPTEKKPLAAAIVARPAAEYEIAAFAPAQRMSKADAYPAASARPAAGWPIAPHRKAPWPTPSSALDHKRTAQGHNGP